MKIGIIGAAGQMGSQYGTESLEKGHDLLVSDINKKGLEEHYSGTNAQICKDNEELVKKSDFVIYSTPIADTAEIIRESAPHLRKDATVGGFTSIKMKEVEALEKYTPPDVEIITLHPMHGPSLDLKGQTFIIVPVRERKKGSQKQEIEEFVRSLGLNISYLPNAKEHDKMMADTQALTHCIHLNMGYAWKLLGFHPKDHHTYQNEVDRIKSLQTMRILSSNPEVYAGIAIYNPEVAPQVNEYTRSLDEIMEKVIEKDKKWLIDKWNEAIEFLGKEELQSSDEILTSLFEKEYITEEQTNSQISLLPMVSVWKEFNINLKDNIAFQTPPYKIRSLLVHKILNGDIEVYIDNAFNRKTQVHDYYYCKSATTFNEIIRSKNYKRFVELFKEIADFFGEEELRRGKSESDDLIKRLVSEK